GNTQEIGTSGRFQIAEARRVGVLYSSAGRSEVPVRQKTAAGRGGPGVGGHSEFYLVIDRKMTKSRPFGGVIPGHIRSPFRLSFFLSVTSHGTDLADQF